MNTSQILELLLNRQPLAPLFPKTVWNAELSREISALETGDAVRAGLLLWNDDLNASHTLSQNIETPTGSLWHALMHRREGDANNSIYWWRKVGAHPAFEILFPRALVLLENERDEDAQNFLNQLKSAQTWQPESFVRACKGGGAWCEKLQHLEFEVFLDWCRDHNE